MELSFSGEIWYWRGPSPFYFVSVPPEQCRDLAEVAGRVSYGWGMVPATVTAGGTTWATALWPKDGGYVVPIKAHVRRDEGLDEGSTVTLTLHVAV